MAKKKIAGKKPEKEEKKSLLDDVTLDITAELDLDTIQLKGNRWLVRLFIESILPRAYHIYKIKLFLNEQPYLEKIEKLEAELSSSLFANDASSRKSTEKSVKEVRDKLDSLRRDCETFSFTASIVELKYKDDGTVIMLRVPDEVIEPFNRQKHRMDLYNVTLEPISV